MIYVVRGQTFRHRDWLKKNGFRWEPDCSWWCIAADEIKDEDDRRLRELARFDLEYELVDPHQSDDDVDPGMFV